MVYSWTKIVTAKINCTGAKADIHFIVQDYSYNISIHNVSIGQCEEVCCSGGHFADPVKS